MDINEIISSPELNAGQKIALLKEKSVEIRPWSDLQKEYDPKLHPVRTDKEYVEKGPHSKLSRVTLGWQKLSTKRMAALMFGLPVKRIYSNTDTDKQKLAAAIMEDIYSKNRIDSVNLERAEWTNATCECITIWYTQQADMEYAGEKTKLKLRCKNYSPIKGNTGLYPFFDEYEDMVALSIEYYRKERNESTGKLDSVTYFDTYTADRHICWNKTTGQLVGEPQPTTIGKIPGIYICQDEPTWEDESGNVYEGEWTLSRQGNYIRKNTRPKLAIYSDNKVKSGQAPKGDNVSSEVVRLGQNDRMEYVSWAGSTDATKFYIEQLRHNFNAQLQLPDVSMDNMKSTPMSGESRKMLLLDSQMKVTRERGRWLEAFDREFNVIRAYAKIMFPGLAKEFDEIRVKHIITPYKILDQKEDVETLSAACNTIASRRTCVKRLGWADDVDEEVRLIEEGQDIDMFPPAN